MYKDLEGKRTEGLGWRCKEEAYDRIRHAIELYIKLIAKQKGRAKIPA